MKLIPLIAAVLLLPAVPAMANEPICYADMGTGIIDLTGLCSGRGGESLAQAESGPTLRFSGLDVRRDRDGFWIEGTVTNVSSYYATSFSLDYEIRTAGGRGTAPRVTDAGLVSSIDFTPRIIPPGGSGKFKTLLGFDYGDVGAGRNPVILSGMWSLTTAAGEIVDMPQQSFR